MNLSKTLLTLKGGAGSGNHDHAGRPGKHGGSAPKGGGSAKAYSTMTHEELSGLYDNYSPDQLDSIKRYTWGAYISINSHLRFGTQAGEFEKNVIKNLDSVFDNSPKIPKDMITYRQIMPNVFNELIKEGAVFQDNAFISTTVKRSLTDGDGELTIRVPKGSKAAYLGDFSSNTYENELLLPRGSKFRVVEKVGNRAVVELISE